MDDQIIEMLTEKFNRVVLHCDFNSSSTAHEDPNIADKDCDILEDESTQLKENSDILKKIINLNTIVQNLKTQHIALSNHVKLATESFPGLDVLKSVELLGAEYELLKRKYLEEYSERRRLYNEVIELKGNIRVFCRCRPLNETEIANGYASIVNFESSPDELQVVCSDSSKKHFKFDHIFRPEDNQEAVFAQTKPIVTSVLDGFNVCIFAYGQTGTGKTFTMEGMPEHRGVNYRTLEELFRVSEERSRVIKYEFSVSMLEVYNEKIRDLLAENSAHPTKKLEIKQAAEGMQEVPGLVETHVCGTEDVWEMLKSGNQVRSVGSTSANELSSRSHCLLRVTVKGENLINGLRTRSHLWLVDLAGSERVGKTEAEGERLKESQFINKSLSALGDVISALASKSAHIPYRNSKLTHILQSSLGGDCKTLMFVQISPSTADLGETLCSLNFATRVRGIESGPARKQADLTELFKYKQMVEKLKHDEKENKKLQDNMQTLQLRLATREFMCRNLQEKVRDLENQIAEERKTRLKQESRSLTSVTAQPSRLSSFRHASSGQKAITKPPLNPSKRPPLRRITNILPPSSPPPSKRRPSHTSSMDRKENIARRTSMTTNTEGLVKPRRRVSIAVRPPAPSTTQILQPRRRVSMATLRPDTTFYRTTLVEPQESYSGSSIKQPPAPSTTQVLQPRRRVSIATLRPDTNVTTLVESSSGKSLSLMRNQRKDRYSRLFAPMPEIRAPIETTPTLMRKDRYSRLFAPMPEMRASVETTPTLMRSSSKFVHSPTQTDSRVAKHLTALALRKPLVWSPLKLRGLKNTKSSSSSLLPSRSFTEM